MTQNELYLAHSKLIKEYEENKTALNIEYANANNPYAIGDVFTDHMGSIRIESIEYSNTYYNGNGNPPH